MILKRTLQWFLKSWMWTASIWLCCALVNTMLHGGAYIFIQSNFASNLLLSYNQNPRFVIRNFFYWCKALAFSYSLLLLLVYRIFTVSVFIGMYTDIRFGQGLAIAACRVWAQTPASPRTILVNVTNRTQFNGDQETQKMSHFCPLFHTRVTAGLCGP